MTITLEVCSNCEDLKDYHNTTYKMAMDILCFDKYKYNLMDEGIKIIIHEDYKGCYSCRGGVEYCP